tara:strand:- start:1535 stop:2056 length:522 start_codon:yes stop_codon:yes gene_type:complete
MARMNITVSETVHAPIERVFATAADIPNCADFIKGIETIETLAEAPPSDDNLGVVGKGYAWRETRIMFGRKATEDMSITEWSPPRGYTVEARSHGSHYISHFTFEETDGQTNGETSNPNTTITMSFGATPETFMAKVMMKLFSAMTKKLTQCLVDDLKDIKAAAEAGEAAGSS